MQSSAEPYGWIEPALTTIHRAHWHRQVKTLTTRPGPVVTVEGKSVLNFASNDYLGLAGDERLARAAIAAIEQYGTGSTGSRLLSGHRPVHEELERAIAHWKQTEAALVFSSGYAANLGTIVAIVGGKDLILADEYNHSSLKNGAKLSGATVLTYPHSNLATLRQLLEQHRATHRRCLILTDGVFSMDGDLCPLPDLLAMANEFSCMVLVDDAHGTGVLGTTGAGVIEHWGCSGLPLIAVGTLSKALGSLGGYVAGSATLIDFLRNRSPSWIYTTALSPGDAAAALAAVQVIQAEPERRVQLWERVKQLQQQLAQYSPFPVLPTGSAIVCLSLPTAQVALRVSQQLWETGIYAPAIRPPTVPTSRLRLSVMATHQPEQIQQLVQAITALDMRRLSL